MVEIPDRLECLFSASVDPCGDSYSIEIPRTELEQRAISSGETYRVAILPRAPRDREPARQQEDSTSTADSMASAQQTPPVSEGDVREVTIETLGDQGDGIAKIERGYVVIVPGTRPDDEVTIEITQTRENVAFAQVQENEDTPDEPSIPDESLAGDTLGTEK